MAFFDVKQDVKQDGEKMVKLDTSKKQQRRDQRVKAKAKAADIRKEVTRKGGKRFEEPEDFNLFADSLPHVSRREEMEEEARWEKIYHEEILRERESANLVSVAKEFLLLENGVNRGEAFRMRRENPDLMKSCIAYESHILSTQDRSDVKILLRSVGKTFEDVKRAISDGGSSNISSLFDDREDDYDFF